MEINDKYVFLSDLLLYNLKLKSKVRPSNFRNILLERPDLNIEINTNIPSSSDGFLMHFVGVVYDLSGIIEFTCILFNDECYLNNYGDRAVEDAEYIVKDGKYSLRIGLNGIEGNLTCSIDALENKYAEDQPVYNKVVSVTTTDTEITSNTTIKTVNYPDNSVNFTIWTAYNQSKAYPTFDSFDTIDKASRLSHLVEVSLNSESLLIEGDNDATSVSTDFLGNSLALPIELVDQEYDQSIEDEWFALVLINEKGIVTDISKDIPVATPDHIGGIKVTDPNGSSNTGYRHWVKLYNNRAYVDILGLDIHRYEVMPDPDDHRGEIVEFIGVSENANQYSTDGKFINGYFYKSIQYPVSRITWITTGDTMPYTIVDSTTSLIGANLLAYSNYKRNSLLNFVQDWSITAITPSITAATPIADITFRITDEDGLFHYDISGDELSNWGILLNNGGLATIGALYDKVTTPWVFDINFTSNYKWCQINVLPAAEWNNEDVTFITDALIDAMMPNLPNY